MEHTEALQSQIAEKYVLGELSEQLRNEYEEHYFDCAACALDVKALSTFMGVSCALLRDEAQAVESAAVVSQRSEDRGGGGWFAWLRPAWVVPVMAALILVVGYQNVVTIPSVRGSAVVASGQEMKGYSLIGATRGESDVVIPVRPNENFTLDMDFTPLKPFDSYTYILQDDQGKVVFQRALPGDKALKELRLTVAAGTVHPGTYNLIFYGGSGASFHASADSEVSRLRFKIEFQS